MFGHAYSPLSWVGWMRWYDRAPTAFNYVFLGQLVAIGGAVFGMVVVLGMKNRSIRTKLDLHGTAHWADKREIEQASLVARDGPGKGAYCGGWKDSATGVIHYLRHNGPEHIITLAPTRSGKGVVIVLPNCLSWEHSLVTNDMKGELWALTAGYRKSLGHRVYKFEPTAEHDSIGINPLSEIRLGQPEEVGDAQNIASMLVDPDGKGMEDHWSKSAYALLTAMLLHVLYKYRATRTASLTDLAFTLTDPTRDVAELFNEMLTNKHDVANLHGEGGMHPTIAAQARKMLNTPDDERGSILSTAISYLSLYQDPLVRKNTCRSDIKMSDIMNSEVPVSLYLVVNPENKDRMRPLMRLILMQMIRVLVRPSIKFVNGQGVMPHKHRMMALLDETPSLGKLDYLQESLAYIAGYGIKMLLIAQDMGQLWTLYGKDETITANCHIRIAYAPNKIETAEWLSKMIGTKTEFKEEVSVSGKRFAMLGDQYSTSMRETSRPLLTPDETMRLQSAQKDQNGQITSPGDMLIFATGFAPIFGTQTLYFLDPTFLARASIPAPPTDRNLADTDSEISGNTLSAALWA